MLGLLIIAKYTTLGTYFSVEKLQALIKDAGNWGLFIFFLVFLVGTLMSVPGAVFLVFAILTYGYLGGILLSYLAAILCAMINFLFARFIGGKALSEIKNKRIQKVLSKVETHPIQTICWLRVFMLLSPVVNYAMALTNIKSRQFFIGNAIAMIFPFAFIILGTVFFRSLFFQEVILVWVKSVIS
ncbi:TVP38/TMEM64 family protein [Aureispira anguillae]|nr:VTT domain-containing protein [Aureispira anguillae]